MNISTRIQLEPEKAIEGNVFLARNPLGLYLRYVVVCVDGQPVGQQSHFVLGGHWRVDDFFVAEPYRGSEASRELRKATYRALAEKTDEFRAWIASRVARPERVLNDPLRLELGIKTEVLIARKLSALYRFSGFRERFATGSGR